VPFTADNLTEKLQWALELSDTQRACWGTRAMQRIQSHYSWEVVTDQYEKLFTQLATE
jgi:glycosyltransferase involved in cell wall biosynthesis